MTFSDGLAVARLFRKVFTANSENNSEFIGFDPEILEFCPKSANSLLGTANNSE
jgi:hypothetical protein